MDLFKDIIYTVAGILSVYILGYIALAIIIPVAVIMMITDKIRGI